MTTPPSTRHDRPWRPQSRVGWWAVALGGLTLTSVVLILTVLALDVVDLPDSFADNWWFGLWGVSIWVSGVSSVIAGAIAIRRHHERSRLVLVATLLGFLPVVLLLSEAALGKV